MKKIIALGIAGIMLISGILTGCGKAQETSNESLEASNETQEASNEIQAGSDESQEEKKGYQTTYGDKQFDNVTINVEVFDRSSAPEGATVVDNKWVDYINQEMNKVGINVNFVAVPRGEETTKIQVMMASGTAPDLILTYDRSLAESYYAKGGIVALNDYVDGEDQAVNLKKYITEEVLDMCRNDDGELWAITARRVNTAKKNLFIRKDWLDKLEMDMPETVDDLYNVLKAFKENNPDGKKDVVAFSSDTLSYSAYGVMEGAFMESVENETQFNISSYRPIYSDDGYVEYLRFLNKLYNEGLMDPEYYVGNSLNELIVNGRVGFFEYGINDTINKDVLQSLQASEPEADIVSLPPLKNVNDGKQYNIADNGNGIYVLIPKTCQNVDAVITYLDWMATKDGGYVINNGFEGEHYQLENGIPMVIDADYNEKDKNWINFDLFLVGNGGYFTDPQDVVDANAAMAPGYEDYVYENYKNAVIGDIIYATPTYVSPIQVECHTEIKLAQDENQIKCITCKPEEFDANIAVYREALKNAGMDKVLEERTAYFTGK